jgi:hypothetical protein
MVQLCNVLYDFQLSSYLTKTCSIHNTYTFQRFNIPDKAVRYSMPAPNSPGQATKLYDEFVRAQDTPVQSLHETLDLSPEVLELGRGNGRG